MPSSKRDIPEQGWDPLMLLVGELVIFGGVYALFFRGAKQKPKQPSRLFLLPRLSALRLRFAFFSFLLVEFTATRFDKILSVNASPSLLVR